ncbi:MAG: hypothetical protein IPO01_11975 [Chitinophagaceae bacterium]|nr:hypothetical protein [Chitinophagaceae bacterium]
MKFQKLISILLLFTVLKCAGQNYKFIYYLDENLNTVHKSKAVIIGKGYIQGNAMILDCFTPDKLIKVVSATFTDSTLAKLNGLYRSYFADNKIESEGYYVNNDMEGLWINRNEQGLITDSITYWKGIPLVQINYEYYYSNLKKDTILSYRYSCKDSLKNTFNEKFISIKNEKEILTAEANFKGERGLLKEYDSLGGVKSDSVFSRNQKEADFIGGENAWRDYLRRTLNANVPADNNAPSGKYMVMVNFIVNENGIVTNIVPENNPGYGTVAEVIRVIKISGRWAPAIRYGRPIKAYRRQPVTFYVEN